MNRVILLTSTVYPAIEGYIVNPEDRKKEYTTAINYYLAKTSYNIVVVDNSDYNFANDIDNIRLESLFYKADGEDAVYGKGYGEAKILDYAIRHSKFLQNVGQIIKITGRHIIVNIESLLSDCKNSLDVYVDVDLKYRYAQSYFFVCNAIFLTKYLLPRRDEMNDSQGAHFEHSLAKALKHWKSDGGCHHEFKNPIFIKGHPGNSSINYAPPSFARIMRTKAKYCLNELVNLHNSI